VIASSLEFSNVRLKDSQRAEVLGPRRVRDSVSPTLRRSRGVKWRTLVSVHPTAINWSRIRDTTGRHNVLGAPRIEEVPTLCSLPAGEGGCRYKERLSHQDAEFRCDGTDGKGSVGPVRRKHVSEDTRCCTSELVFWGALSLILV
jgi:hypothetical protein